MTKATILWPGDRMRSFFRAHIMRHTKLDGVAADRLADALTRATNRMLVWDGSAASDGTATSSEPGQAGTANGTPIEQKAFDPYLFSAMVVLSKQGREHLLQRLNAISDTTHLRALAEAQHLAVDDALRKAEDIRVAIVDATERRLKDRKAAAS